ncbi:MAG TPA: aromatic-ring-hydroxylating dioxygenase subunit beta [Chloroflexota bacterium]|nr:aromatic-ring-hydroxylating dioxygenase subunit beta [Chloroflexota bacterium]
MKTSGALNEDLRLHHEALMFLVREAELLDNRDLHGWLAMLTPDIDYRIPVRVTRERAAAASEFSGTAFHMVEDWGSLKARVDRFDSEFAWSEDPPSRTRRLVGNVRVEPGETAAELSVKSNLLVFRAHGESAGNLLAAERCDALRRVGGELRLAKRLVLLDHTALPTHNLAIFL